MDKRRIGTILIWVGSVLLVAMILLPGASKFFDAAGWTDRFINNWGLPAWLVPVVGAAEILGAILLLIPRTAPLGGAILAGIMLGATFTHALNDEMNRVPLTLALMVIALAIAIVRFKRGSTKKTAV